MSFDTVEKLQLLASSAVYNHCFLVKKYIKIHDSVMSFFRDGCDHVRLNYARRISHSSWVAPAPLGLRAEEMQSRSFPGKIFLMAVKNSRWTRVQQQWLIQTTYFYVVNFVFLSLFFKVIICILPTKYSSDITTKAILKKKVSVIF